MLFVKQFVVLLILVMGNALLSGCETLFGEEQGYFRDRTQDYLLTENPKTLTLPEHLSQDAIQPLHRIPEDPKAFQSITPEEHDDKHASLELAPVPEQTDSIDISNQLAYNIVEHSPDRVWLMSEFALQNSGYEIKQRDLMNRVMKLEPNKSNQNTHESLKLHLNEGEDSKQTKLEVFNLAGDEVDPAVKNQVINSIVEYMKSSS